MHRLKLNPIANDDEFERFCCEVAKDVFGDFSAQRYGRSGQKQGGIDIRATNRRRANESIGIQCKFKAKPDAIKLPALIAEIKSECVLAFAKHPNIDEFIFASTWPRDQQLQDEADKLAKTYGKSVHIWSWDDLVDSVNAHPRLQRLFAQGHASFGVDLIDADFIDGLDSEGVTPFAFYSGLSENHLQWSGVVRDFDAPRICRALIDDRIDALFAKPVLANRVAAVVHGDGGCGKSTLLRRIAIDRARSGDCVCWWVESLDQFLTYDAVSIGESQHLRHLVFIDDWYRNVRTDDAGDFFIWLKSASARNVRVVIGDRKAAGRSYMQNLYAGNEGTHALMLAENRAILDRVLNVVTGTAPASQWLQQHIYLVEKTPLFMVLFVLSHDLQTQNGASSIDFDDGIKGRFQAIIAKKLTDLEINPRYRGFGRALRLLGHMYASEESKWQSFSEDSLISIASFFAGVHVQPTFAANWKYPEALSALIHREASVRGVTLCRFNHDVVAEQGLSGALARDAGLEVDLEASGENLHQLLAHLVTNKIAGGASTVWCWITHRGGFSSEKLAIESLMEVLRLHASVVRAAPIWTMLDALRLPASKVAVSQILLRDVGLLVKLGPKVCPMLAESRNLVAGKAAAREILGTENFVQLPKEIVSTGLKIIGNEEAGKAAARVILDTKYFVTLPFEIVSTALRIVGNEEAGKAAARVILGTENFVQLPKEIVSTGLKIVGNEEAGKAAARVILDTKNFVTLPFEIVSTALRIVGNEEAGKAAARVILDTENFVILPSDIVSTALNVVDDKVIKRRAALHALEPTGGTTTFVQFAALRALAEMTDALTRSIVGKFVVSALYDTSTAGSFRLRYDLLFLPYSWVREHASLLRKIAANYRPECASKTKGNVFQILRCRREYPAQPEVEKTVKELRDRVVQCCVEDIDHQWQTHPQHLRLAHIMAAVELLSSATRARDVLQRVRAYAATNPAIESVSEFQNLLAGLATMGDS